MAKVESVDTLVALSQDVLFEIASKLDYDSIKNLCQSNERLQKRLCQNDDFWLYKYEK